MTTPPPIEPERSPPRSELGRPRLFYGWHIVGVAFVCQFLSAGFLFYSYGVLFKPVAADLGGSRLEVSLGVSAVNVVMALFAPALGRVVDRGQARAMIVAGSLVAAAGFVLLSQVQTLWQFNLALALPVGAGMVAMGNLAPTALVARWFSARRGTAMGIALMGMSVAGLTVPLVSTWLIDGVGWRSTLLAYAFALTFVLVPLAVWQVVEFPAGKGLRPDGAPDPPPVPEAKPAESASPPRARTSSAGSSTPASALTTRGLLAQPAFWTIAITIGLLKCAFLGVATHLIPWLTDIGLSPYEAAGLLSLTAAAGMAGKLAFGMLSDHISPRTATLLSIGLQLLGLLGMLNASPGWSVAAACGVFGFGVNGISPLHCILTARAFGPESFGRVMGLMRPVMLPLVASGAPLAGYAFDLWASYDQAFTCFAALYVLGAILLALSPVETPLAKEPLSPRSKAQNDPTNHLR